MVISIAPFIGHKQHFVDGFGNGAVVVALVQQPRLVGGGLGGQCGDDRDSPGD